MGSYGHLGVSLNEFLNDFRWKVIGLIYHQHSEQSGRGHSDCHNALSAVFRATNDSAYHQSFDEEASTRLDYRAMLQVIQSKARSKIDVSASADLELVNGIGFASFIEV